MTSSPRKIFPKPGTLKAWPTCVTPAQRSEEHTSELQSRLHLVCRLLLEKKKHRLTAEQSHASLLRRAVAAAAHVRRPGPAFELLRWPARGDGQGLLELRRGYRQLALRPR